MSVDGSRGRIITFVIVSIAPVRYAPMSHWYRPESATSITARLRDYKEWRIHEIRLRDGHLVWTYGGAEHAWRPVPAHERPDWLDARLARAHEKMDAAEAEA